MRCSTALAIWRDGCLAESWNVLAGWTTKSRYAGTVSNWARLKEVLALHHAVRQCAVVVRESAANGKTLVAFFEAEGEADPAISDLRAHLKTELPDYMVPSALIPMKVLPLDAEWQDRSEIPV